MLRARLYISSVWSSGETEPLGRNRYIELELKKSRTASHAREEKSTRETLRKDG